jgi:SAM-dependent methyltransferase
MTTWGPDLFAGAAPYYARYRVYLDAFYDAIARACGLPAPGRLLDMGCGTGQICVRLAPMVDEAIGLDPDPDMLAEAGHGARDVPNVRFVRGRAEDASGELGSFVAVTIGNAFHWMDRARVLDVVWDILEPGGTLVVCGAGGDHEVFAGVDPRPLYGEVIARYLGPERRAGAATFTHPLEPHQDVIARSPFGEPELWSVPVETTRSIDDLVGLLFSTSFANRRLLGADADAFEAEIRRVLTEAEPSGLFSLRTDYEVIVARRG